MLPEVNAYCRRWICAVTLMLRQILWRIRNHLQTSAAVEGATVGRGRHARRSRVQRLRGTRWIRFPRHCSHIQFVHGGVRVEAPCTQGCVRGVCVGWAMPVHPAVQQQSGPSHRTLAQQARFFLAVSTPHNVAPKSEGIGAGTNRPPCLNGSPGGTHPGGACLEGKSGGASPGTGGGRFVQACPGPHARLSRAQVPLLVCEET